MSCNVTDTVEEMYMYVTGAVAVKPKKSDSIGQFID